MTASTVPICSIIVPAKSVTPYLSELFHHLRESDSPEWEVLVVLDDAEGLIDGEGVRWLSSGPVGPAAKRDLACSKAFGDYFLFLDDDSYPSPSWIRAVIHEFRCGHVAVAGPGVTPPNASRGERCSGAVYLTTFGGGFPARYRPVGTGRFVSDWPTVNLAVSRKAFEMVGGFGSSYWPGEDTLFCDKLILNGMEIRYEPRVVVYHHRRRTLREHLRQVGNYGLHRGNFFRHQGRSSRKLAFVIPSIATLALGLSATMFLATQDPVALTPVLLYAAAIAVNALHILRLESPWAAVASFIYVPTTHIWYGLRFAHGALLSKSVDSKLR